MNRAKQPLYRKCNKTAHGFHLPRPNGHFRHERNTQAMERFEGTHMAMGETNIGFDYTPLFQFLLSKVGGIWDEIFSEAVSRLDKQEPVFWMVELDPRKMSRPIVRIGESSYYSKLTVADGVLVKIDPDAGPPAKSNTCCTFTFNGRPY